MLTSKRIRKIGTLIVLLHLGVVLQHGSDHARLSIPMTPWQTAFIELVIVVAPLAAALLLWTRLQRAGLYLLATSMAGSLIFGVWYHFVAPGADNAFTMAKGPMSAAFQVTAGLLAIIEAGGCAWSGVTLGAKPGEQASRGRRRAA